MRTFFAAIACASALFAAPPAFGQRAAEPSLSAEQVRSAISDARDFLLSKQTGRGTWTGMEIYPGCEQLPLESLPTTSNGTRKVSALDLDGINQLLAAVNDVFCRGTGPGGNGPCRRISVSEVPGDTFPEGEDHADL